jgi:hypothetical protein
MRCQERIVGLVAIECCRRPSHCHSSVDALPFLITGILQVPVPTNYLHCHFQASPMVARKSNTMRQRTSVSSAMESRDPANLSKGPIMSRQESFSLSRDLIKFIVWNHSKAIQYTVKYRQTTPTCTA